MAVTEPLDDPALTLFQEDSRVDWVRLRTFLVLRWLAILGQTVAVVIAAFYLGLRVELGLCFLAIGASVISNLIAMTEDSLFGDVGRVGDVNGQWIRFVRDALPFGSAEGVAPFLAVEIREG